MTNFRDRIGQFRGFSRDTKGASALEFAIVAAPCLLLLLALFDVALRYAGNVALEHAVSEAGRFIRTGQAQQWGEEGFKQKVCAEVTPPITCDGLRFDVQTFDSLKNVELTGPKENNEDYSYQPGGRNEVVVVRVFYEWPLINYLPGFGDWGQENLIATAVFRNEPF